MRIFFRAVTVTELERVALPSSFNASLLRMVRRAKKGAGDGPLRTPRGTQSFASVCAEARPFQTFSSSRPVCWRWFPFRGLDGAGNRNRACPAGFTWKTCEICHLATDRERKKFCGDLEARRTQPNRGLRSVGSPWISAWQQV